MIKKLLFVVSLAVSTSLWASEDKHFDAAMDVVIMPQGEQLELMVSGLVDAQMNANPSIRPLRGAFERFYQEVFQSEAFLQGLAEIQMETFTYEELVELKTLMKLPIFIKYQAMMPEILPKHMQLGQQVVMKHQDRLIELIELENKKIEELQRLDKQLNLVGDE